MAGRPRGLEAAARAGAGEAKQAANLPVYLGSKLAGGDSYLDGAVAFSSTLKVG